MKSNKFSLPSKKALIEDLDIEVVFVDATECEIERPQKKQKRYYSGKKKRHTLKIQLIVDAKTLNVICFTVAQGHVHDFRIFKECGVYIPERIQAILDSGYTDSFQLPKPFLIHRL